MMYKIVQKVVKNIGMPRIFSRKLQPVVHSQSCPISVRLSLFVQIDQRPEFVWSEKGETRHVVMIFFEKLNI